MVDIRWYLGALVVTLLVLVGLLAYDVKTYAVSVSTRSEVAAAYRASARANFHLADIIDGRAVVVCPTP